MKKLTTLLVVLLFSAGAALAQSSEAYITQLDENNDAFLTQSDGAYATVTQETNGYNLLTGMGQQDAWSHSGILDLYQAHGWGTNAKGRSGNELKMMQYGKKNEIVAIQHNAGFAKMEQHGERNYAKIQQYLGPQELDLYQKNNGNSMFLLQNRGSSYADVDQTGFRNSLEGIGASRGEQINGPNELYLLQKGNNNILRLLQDGIDSSMLPNYAKVDQFSNGNLAEVSQTGGNNNIVLTQ
jgi:hypothetical protein